MNAIIASFFYLFSIFFIPQLISYPGLFFLKTHGSPELMNITEKLCSVITPHKQTFYDPEQGKPLELKTTTGISVPALFFDRNKTKIIILGQGFPGTKEDLLKMAQFFHEYDVIAFDYRWHDLLTFLCKPSTLLHPIKKLVLEEKEEVCAVLSYVKTLKKYDEVIGLGQCYSALTFLMAQSEAEKNGTSSFTKLILDSCWLSFEAFAESISLDPWLPANPQEGGAPEFLKRFLKKPVIRSALLNLARLLIPHVSCEPYLSQVHQIPLFFIHGTGDLMVPYPETFNKIWQATTTSNKVALITPYQHSYHTKNKAIFKYACNTFIAQKACKEFIKCLTT